MRHPAAPSRVLAGLGERDMQPRAGARGLVEQPAEHVTRGTGEAEPSAALAETRCDDAVHEPLDQVRQELGDLVNANAVKRLTALLAHLLLVVGADELELRSGALERADLARLVPAGLDAEALAAVLERVPEQVSGHLARRRGKQELALGDRRQTDEVLRLVGGGLAAAAPHEPREIAVWRRDGVPLKRMTVGKHRLADLSRPRRIR